MNLEQIKEGVKELPTPVLAEAFEKLSKNDYGRKWPDITKSHTVLEIISGKENPRLPFSRWYEFIAYLQEALKPAPGTGGISGTQPGALNEPHP